MTNRPKTPPYFDEEEQELMEAVERGEFQPSKDAAERIAILKKAAIDSVNEREAKNIRFYKRDLQRMRVIAAQKGIPYQTLISSVIHQYATGQLKEA